jgi:thiamine-monophosphate kinase
MNESEFIRLIASRFPRCPRQGNGLFACDAEIVPIGGRDWALSLDDFSPEEDLFTLAEPETLGHNLAVATLSDLLAAGAEPAFFMHAVSLPRETGADTVRALSDGIAAVLAQAGCFLVGGDTGMSATWRYCGYAMGPVAAPRPLTRILPALPQELWVTGRLGDANLAAFRQAPPPRFELRLAEARALWPRATACMDTSGGLMDALWTFRTLNPGLRLSVDVGAVPMDPAVAAFASASGFPAGAAWLGGAGEYELLAAAPADLDAAVRAEWLRLGLTRIGAAEPDPAGGLRLCFKNGNTRDVAGPPPDARAAATVADHAREVMERAAALFGEGGP